MVKRKLESEWDVSETQESSSATVHSVVTEVSPVKVSQKNASVRYFDRRMTDGKTVRGWCEPSLRNALESARQKRK